MTPVSFEEIKDQLRSFVATEKTRKKKKLEFEGLFTDVRIDPSTIPEGRFMYCIRHSDNDWGAPRTIEPRVVVNFFGTVILDKEIEFPNPNDKYIPIKDFWYTD